MTNVWFTADPHFGHANIIEYESRPFHNAFHMNEALIHYWNQKVKKNDHIFVLGDFALGSKEMIGGVLERLQGYKTLIMGNHDLSRKTMLQLGFDEVSKHPIIYKDFYILSHEPKYLNRTMPYANLHGHIHSNKLDYEGYYNVGVDIPEHGFAPVNFLTIQAKFAATLDKSK